MEKSYEERKEELARDRQIQQELIQEEWEKKGRPLMWKFIGIVSALVLFIIIAIASYGI